MGVLMMIDVRHAVQLALDFVNGIFSQEPPINLRLEEISLSEDEKLWTITFSFFRPTSELPNYQAILNAIKPPEREYKSINIDSTNGKFVSMKIRQLV
jgi:hypothetical protein